MAGVTPDGETGPEFIKVLVRIRPFLNLETTSRAGHCLSVDNDASTITVDPNTGSPSGAKTLKKPTTFNFDHIVDGSTREPVIAKIFAGLGDGLLDAVLEGYSSCIFAMGQTGSGKTYLMSGSSGEEGLVALVCRDLLNKLGSTHSRGRAKFSLEMSYLEIYHEKINDLLRPKKTGVEPPELRLHTTNDSNVYVEGLVKNPVSRLEDILTSLRSGDRMRTIGRTPLNAASSRGHAVLTIYVTATTGSGADETKRTSNLNFVDLIGSELAPKGESGVQAEKNRTNNSSLTALAVVLKCLAEKSVHIPYRDSKLTLLLSASLGGYAKTVIIANISPADSSYVETMATLRYAKNAKEIITRSTRARALSTPRVFNEASSQTEWGKGFDLNALFDIMLAVEDANSLCTNHGSPFSCSVEPMVAGETHTVLVRIRDATSIRSYTVEPQAFMDLLDRERSWLLHRDERFREPFYGPVGRRITKISVPVKTQSVNSTFSDVDGKGTLRCKFAVSEEGDSRVATLELNQIDDLDSPYKDAVCVKYNVFHGLDELVGGTTFWATVRNGTVSLDRRVVLNLPHDDGQVVCSMEILGVEPDLLVNPVQLNASLQSERQETARLKEALEKLKRDGVSVRDELVHLEDQNKLLTEKWQRLERELQDALRKIEQYQAEQRQRRQSMNGQEAALMQLQGTLDHKDKMLNSMQSDLDNSHKEIENATAALHQREDEFLAAKNNLADVTNQLAALKRELHAAHEAHKKKVRHLEAEMEHRIQAQSDSMLEKHQKELSALEAKHAAEMAALQEKLQALREEARTQEAALRSTLAEYKGHADSSHDNLGKAIDENSRLKQENASLQEEITLNKEKLHSIRQKMAEHLRSCKDQHLKDAELIAQQKAALEDNERLIRGLQEKLASVQKKLDAVNQAYAACRSQLEALERTSSAGAHEAELERDALVHRVKLLEEAAKVLEGRFAALKASNAELQEKSRKESLASLERIHHLEDEVMGLSNKVGAAEVENRQALEKLRASQSRAQALDDELTQTKLANLEKLAALEATLDGMRQNLADEQNARKTSADNMRLECAQMQTQIDAGEQAIRTAAKAQMEAEERESALQASVRELSAALDASMKDRESESQKAVNEVVALRKSLAELEAAMNALSRRNGELEKALVDSSAVKEENANNLHTLEARCAASELASQQLLADLAAHKNQVADLKQQLQMLQEMCGRLEGSLAVTDRGLQERARQLQTANASLDACRAQEAALQTEFNGKLGEVQQLRGQLRAFELERLDLRQQLRQTVAENGRRAAVVEALVGHLKGKSVTSSGGTSDDPNNALVLAVIAEVGILSTELTNQLGLNPRARVE